MAPVGWQRLIPSAPCFQGEGQYPVDAYSEFIPPPRLGWKPYQPSPVDPFLFRPDDPFGWWIGEFEVAGQLQPGLPQVARPLLHLLQRLRQGDASCFPAADLADNPFYPPELAGAGSSLPHERGLALLALALSRTQDDKGRWCWTLFGGSEQGPARAFWKSFFINPRKPLPEADALPRLGRILRIAYGEEATTHEGLLRAGLRILTPEADPLHPDWQEGPLPPWTAPFLLDDRASLKGVRYLLTFRPFARLPARIRSAYLEGRLHLLPCPHSLLFWGSPRYRLLEQELPLAQQIPLRQHLPRHSHPTGLRVPQSGIFHEAGSRAVPAPHATPHLRGTYRRTHRWQKVLRDEDERALMDEESPLLHVLFSTIPEDLHLYGKPMARNVQLWTEAGKLLLDGPRADAGQLEAALHTLWAGGVFGYRFQFPAMQVGLHEVYWQLPLIAFPDRESGEPVVLSPFEPEGLAGYLTAYRADKPQPSRAVELWPRFRDRPVAKLGVRLLELGGPVPIREGRNLRKLADASSLLGDKPLPRSLARALLTCRHDYTLEHWLDSLPPEAPLPEVRRILEECPDPVPRRPGARTPTSFTYARTAGRRFEEIYWKTIAFLAEGRFLNKNNADCVRDTTTQNLLTYPERQLEQLGDYLLDYYEQKIEASGLAGQAIAGSVPFRWETCFDFSWMGGWLENRERPAERDLLVVIPGRDRSRAVIMADHYDTAYMADRYEREQGGHGARLAACGADDNHSATAALMLGAPIFLALSKQGLLDCDIWLVHLTGEEFPADCLGARALTRRLVEGTLQLHQTDGGIRDLSGTRVQGVYVLDMIAHNNDHDRNVFQIAPGTGAASFWLAWQAHLANEVWNLSVPVWNQKPERVGQPRGRRSPHGAAIPRVAPHLGLAGEIRPFTDPRSTLYNTDGQIFSDAGIPVVLFMENYDISRVGYHDTHDTMANIDLDYGSALAAITIETVARAACVPPPG
jgi:hypothetical protein